MKLQIGRWVGEYRFFKTNAPRRYDGFGTITLNDVPSDDMMTKETERIVAILIDQIEWHKARYASGLYLIEEEADDGGCISSWATDIIIKRILKEGA